MECFQGPGPDVINLLTSVLYVHIKLECLLPAGPISLVICLWVRPGAYPRVEHLKSTLLYGGLRPYLQTLG